ncbi:MAG: aminopeptidase P family protein, partial [Calditrichaeota bacterium]
KKAAHIVNRVKDEAFALVGSRIKSREAVSELDVQRFILEAFDKEKMVTDEPPIVAVNANASNPHYAPSPERFSPIRKGDLLLIDLFGKLNLPDAIFADITWMGFVGEALEEKHVKVFEVVKNGRDAGLHLLQEAAQAGRTIQGWEVDARVRQVIKDAGYGEYFHHRTGHSLDTSLHGNGVNLDSLETQDQRQIIPGVGFTIEPGVYLEEFGVRSEINVFYSSNGPEVFGPIQEEILKLL